MAKHLIDPEKHFRATYRLQLRKEFKLQDAAAITDYLEDLGISHLYLSPVLESRAGSNHGYDGTDPTRISEERGGEPGFQKLISSMRKRPGLTGVILDIVPNHLAAHPTNVAWWDLLKHGPDSRFFKTFDLRPRHKGDKRIVLPVLGKSLQAVVASREISVSILGRELVFQYYETNFPVTPKSYGGILRASLKDLQTHSKTFAAEIENLLNDAASPGSLTKFEDYLGGLAKRPKELKTLKSALSKLSLRTLESIFSEQYFSLKDWRSGSREINYRRFFDINDLAAIRVEDKEVFDWAHSKISELVRNFPEVQGLRVDHVDGLTDPKKYLEDLRALSPYVWIEKILGEGEKLNPQWPVTGSTGYEFTNISSRLFVDVPGLLHLHSHYNYAIDDRWERFHDCVYDSKREMLESHFPAELNALLQQFYRIAGGEHAADFSLEELQEAMIEVTSSLRVYRTYATRGEPLQSPWLEAALAETESRGKLQSKAAFNWLKAIFEAPGDWGDETYKALKRWEQLTGPVMAKGLEDTALYRYCPLLSLNGVGGEPDWAGDGLMEFHSFNQDRLRTHPESMSTTSTHDSKRSEDVRSRIHVLSEFAHEWTKSFEAWHRAGPKGERPKPKDEYMIFETILGTWPADGRITEDYISRLQQYFRKAAREAKTESSWSEPNAHYEGILSSFIQRLLKPKDPKGRKLFLAVEKFAQKCAYFGAFNSLSALALKALSPGLPDFYQGCELWDLSLVDPDNRRPVDYAKRRKYLALMKEGMKRSSSRYLERVLSHWSNGEIKLWLTHQLLQLRKQMPALFTHGEYLVLEPQGEGKSHFISFLRHHQNEWVLALAPKFLPRREKLRDKLEIRNNVILSTEFSLPPDAPRMWTSALTGETLEGSQFTADMLLAGLPVGVWKASH